MIKPVTRRIYSYFMASWVTRWKLENLYLGPQVLQMPDPLL